jgi:hypothetical protein
VVAGLGFGGGVVGEGAELAFQLVPDGAAVVNLVEAVESAIGVNEFVQSFVTCVTLFHPHTLRVSVFEAENLFFGGKFFEVIGADCGIEV